MTQAVAFDGGRGQGAELRLVNPWLWSITISGAMIAVADGLSRSPFVEWAADIEGPLQYQPYLGTYVFAFVMLLLCLLYAASEGLKRTEAVFLWFVLCTVAYTKDFAYLRVPGTPLFVTDIVLAFLLIRLFAWPRVRWVWPRTRTVKLLYLFWFAGLLAAARGLLSGQAPMLVARDSAIVVYSLFLLVGAYVVQDWAALRRFFIFFAIGAAFASLNGLAWFLAHPDQRRFIPYGVYVLAAFVGTLLLTLNRLLPKGAGWALTALLGAGLLLANARTIFVSLAILLGVVFFIGASVRKTAPVSRVKLLAWAATAAVCVLVVVLQTEAGSAFVSRASEELVAGTLQYSDDPNAQYRLVAWTEALSRFVASPIIGEGFGVPFVFARSDFDPRPHNTYLTVLYKMGLLGFLPLVSMLLYFYRTAWKALRFHRRQKRAIFLYVLLIGHGAMCLFGLLNLLLESPFLAAVFWALFGVGFRLFRLLADNAVQETGRTVYSQA